VQRFRPTVAVVDLDAIRHNVRTLTPEGSEVMAVVKANGYGHGDVETARAAVEGGATWLGVALGQASKTFLQSHAWDFGIAAVHALRSVVHEDRAHEDHDRTDPHHREEVGEVDRVERVEEPVHRARSLGGQASDGKDRRDGDAGQQHHHGCSQCPLPSE